MDGRVLMEEYKGAQIVTTDYTKEKKTSAVYGREKCKGKGLYLMAQKMDGHGRGVYRQIADKIGKSR